MRCRIKNERSMKHFNWFLKSLLSLVSLSFSKIREGKGVSNAQGLYIHTKVLLFFLLMPATSILFGCNTASQATDLTSAQNPLPTPNVSSIPAAEPSTIPGIPLNGGTSPAGDCHLALDIPWEHDAQTPITDENAIMEILRALGDLEECRFARQEGWLHHYVVRDGVRTENEVLAHLTEEGEFVDLRYNLVFDEGQYTAEQYYDGRKAGNQWCNISDEENKRVIQVMRNCTPTEVYSLLTGNNVVDGYVGEIFYTFLAAKKFPSPSPGYYLPRIWFAQEGAASFLVIESKHDMSDVSYGQDTTEKPLKDELRRTTIDLQSGKVTRYFLETTFKDGRFQTVTEDLFLLYYSELPADIEAAIRLDD